MKSWRIGAVWLVVALAGVALAWYWHNARVERAALAARDVVAITGRDTALANVEFYRDVKPILDRRCVVCHGGYDAPCQLKLDAPEGLARGAAPIKVFDSTRPREISPSRLFVDAQSSAEWRHHGFFSVLNEADQTLQANLDNSVLYQMLQLKRQHAQSEGESPSAIDFAPQRKDFCPSAITFPEYAQKYPSQGMPFALPGLDDEKFATLQRWLEGGARINPPVELAADVQRRVDEWERFLNRDDAKTQLMARYVYEHLFLADLYLDSSAPRQLFKLVRSRTAPGQPLQIVATRRPLDDPITERVYYRLQPYRATVVAKTHLPYRFDVTRQQRFEQLFLQADYRVEQLPSYEPEAAANPFITYAALPVRARYQFLLDDAEFFIKSFTKGPALRGQLALNVLDDRFWVLFITPDNGAGLDEKFLAAETANLNSPGELQNKSIGLPQWRKYAEAQTKYLGAKDKFLLSREGAAAPAPATLDLIWSGDANNQSAALTVFRHSDSASVATGLVGELPKTAWVIDYPMFERMYYLLAAGFDVYSDGSEQLLTRLYTDFFRMEGESNFLNFLPKAQREKERNGWYQGANASARDSIYRKTGAAQRETGIVYKTKNPKREFFDLVKTRLGPALSHRYENGGAALLTLRARNALAEIAQLHGRAVSYLPEVVFIRVIVRDEADQLFTLVHNTDYANVSLLSLDSARRQPQFDGVTLVPGIIGAYPNAFWVVSEKDLPKLARKLGAVEGARSYRALTEDVAITRSDSRFWQESDWMLNEYRNLEPIEWGVLDYSRYER